MPSKSPDTRPYQAVLPLKLEGRAISIKTKRAYTARRSPMQENSLQKMINIQKLSAIISKIQELNSLTPMANIPPIDRQIEKLLFTRIEKHYNNRRAFILQTKVLNTAPK